MLSEAEPGYLTEGSNKRDNEGGIPKNEEEVVGRGETLGPSVGPRPRGCCVSCREVLEEEQ